MSFLEVKEISKSFGNLKVLKNVNLSVKEGEKIVIIGGSGCGKSVFLRLLERLEEPDGGQIYIDGEKTTIDNPDEAMKKGNWLLFNGYCFGNGEFMSCPRKSARNAEK